MRQQAGRRWLRTIGLAALLSGLGAELCASDADPAAGGPPPPPPATGAGSAAAVHQAEAAVATSQHAVDRLLRLIASQGQAIAELQSRRQELESAYADQQRVLQELPLAKAASDAANQQVYQENQQNHNFTTNSGGATPDSVKAQQDAQQRYEQLRGQAADAPATMDLITQNLHALAHDAAFRARRLAEYQHQLDQAQAALAQATAALADLQPPPAGPSPAASAAPAGAVSAPPAAPPAVPTAPSSGPALAPAAAAPGTAAGATGVPAAAPAPSPAPAP